MDKRPDFWKNNKRYYDLKSYWRNLFGCNVYKLPIDAGFTCPNRDGKVGWGGCIYCDGRGSKLRQAGALPSVAEQIRKGKEYYRQARQAKKFIAYFQTFTNTYGELGHLKALYDEALEEEDVIGISVGTRPDCLPRETIALLENYARTHHVWVEVGLQSIHDHTLALINRGHDASCFLNAIERLADRGINICVHIIVGLPGETRRDILKTAQTLACLPIQGIKIHSLLILDGTALGNMYREGKITLMSKDEYILTVCDILEILPPQMVIQRLTADGYKDIFLAPAWAINKLEVINGIDQELKRRDTWQGKKYCPD
ncbi:MAG TPA: TIGR01212 family radical SAM protein [Syntrophales bacterium]|nr:TIGR01212 family radical SAM protein [Syntrophales bacterium]HOL59645.1 TIGR01212 family radical SAM protein [Syntrophales bacterium]HPO35791.1 TIGR01212 family radical SAM protein [Syntrophales bacterium]